MQGFSIFSQTYNFRKQAHLCVTNFLYYIWRMATDKTKRPSYRIELDQEDVDFMNDYKATHGSSIQWFVEKSVQNRIQEIKIKQQLKEL